MQIQWHGGSTIQLKNKKQRALLNPSSKEKLKDAQVVVYDHTDEKRKIPEEGLMFDWPGEYDTAGFSFRGIEHKAKKGISIPYTFHFPQGNVAWMGEMTEYPDKGFIEALGEVHVLVVPVGDKGVLNAKDAFRLVEELEPMVVIPICYGDKRDGLSAFLKEMDVKHPEAQKSYDFKRSSLSSEQMELVILDAA